MFRVEDPFPDYHRSRESSPLLRRCSSKSDCQTSIPRQSSQPCAGNCEILCTILWMLPNVGQNTMLSFGTEVGGFHLGVASPCHFFLKGLQTYILVHGDDFFVVGRRERRKHALCLLRSAYELSKVVTLRPESSQSGTVSFGGQNADIATMENRVRARPPACFPRLEGFGFDRCQGCGDSWNRRRGWAQSKSNQ